MAGAPDTHEISTSLVGYFTLWTGQALSSFGSQLAQFALIWWLTLEAGSATALAVATLMAQLPHILLGPVIGVLIDRFSRKRILLVSDSVVALASLVLAALFLLNAAALWMVYAVLLVRALGIAFHGPTMMASTALMVPEAYLTRVQGMNHTLGGILSIVTAPLAALLLVYLPIQAFLLLDFATAIFAVIPLVFIALPQPRRSAILQIQAEGVWRALWADLVIASRYVWARKGLLMLILFAVVVNIFLNPTFNLLPIFVSTTLEGGAPRLAALEAALGAGTILGGLLMSTWGGFKNKVGTMLLGIITAGLGITLIAASSADAFVFSLAGCAVAALAIPVINAPFFATLQKTVPADLQGRVFTLTSSVAAAATPVGLMIAGTLADGVGVRPVFFVCGVCSVCLGTLGFLLRPLFRLEGSKPQ